MFLLPTSLALFLATSVLADGTVPAVATTWFAGWHALPGVNPLFDLAKIPWAKYTSLAYAFAITTDDVDHIAVGESDRPILTQFVQAAHAHGVEARLSWGGWGGSQFFSYAMAPANRTATINAILKIVSQYKLDGIDFDWEYPGKQGIGCNIVSPNDTANFLATVQQLRSTSKGANLTLTAAVAFPFADETGQQSTDLSGFAQSLDYIQIMNYDVNGNWSTGLGPNAPLNDSCVADPSTEAQGSAVSFVKAWTSAGFPPNKIVLGVASYGHTFFVENSTITSPDVLSQWPAFDAGKSQGPALADTWTNTGGDDQCGNFVPAGGTMDYWGLVQNGFLTANGSVAIGIEHSFDDCSQTDYVFNPNTNVAVSYDSPRAFAAKGQYIQQTGLRGFAMWEAGGDHQNQLVNAIRSGIGFNDSSKSVPQVPIVSASTSSSSSGNTSSSDSPASSLSSTGSRNDFVLFTLLGLGAFVLLF